MASTITENAELAGTEFAPFNDTNQQLTQKSQQLFVNTKQNYDTTQFDRFRQGVSLRTSKHVFESSQPKIWSGNLKHSTKVVTFGQARSFVEYDDSITFTEKSVFDPVWFIRGSDYPLPILFNDGPQQE